MTASKPTKFRNLKADPKDQVASFERVRLAHQTETAEDYVEMISDLIAVQGEARVIDLAERFGVSNATVNKVVQRLNREGLVVNRPYRSLFLSEKGQSLADFCRKRHEVVMNFLLAIGIPRRIAEMDAEGVEHHVSPETLAVFEKLGEGASKAKQATAKPKAKKA